MRRNSREKVKRKMNKYDIPGVRTFEFTRILGIENIEFGRHIIVDDFAFIYATTPMKIGNYVHIACFSSVIGGADLILEDFIANVNSPGLKIPGNN